MNTFRLRDIGGDLLVESLAALTPADMAQITASLPDEDQGRVVGWRLVAKV